ncbi:MAG: 3-methyl-2-oxobutanoate hydroxymethyltransferase [Ilumatobacteraceae bacterium]
MPAPQPSRWRSSPFASPTTTRQTPMITMGMGCGSVCDTIYLFSCDVLGTNSGHYPRHSKRYADFVQLEAELQHKRVAALKAFVDDVASGGYPEPHHQVDIDDEAFDEVLKKSQCL